MKTKRILVACLVSSSLLFSCKKDPDQVATPQKPNEGEVITTVTMEFTDTESPFSKTTATIRDPDGKVGNDAVQVDTIKLQANRTYNVEVLLLDETKNPIDTISQEVEEEGDEHQFFYTKTNADMEIKSIDADKNGVPIGLKTIITTGGATTGKNGTLLVTLKHQDDKKPKSGEGDINIGDTDIEVPFPVIIR